MNRVTKLTMRGLSNRDSAISKYARLETSKAELFESILAFILHCGVDGHR